MLKLSNSEQTRLMTLGLSLNAYFAELTKAKEAFEAECERIISEMESDKEEARGILEDAANEAESYYDEKSEKWQEGERGCAYQEWAQRLRELSDAAGEDVEKPELEDFEAPDWINDLAECEFAEFEF